MIFASSFDLRAGLSPAGLHLVFGYVNRIVPLFWVTRKSAAAQTSSHCRVETLSGRNKESAGISHMTLPM